MSLLSSNKLIIKLDKPAYKPGDAINGNISCAFGEIVKMDSLTVTLVGAKKYTSYTMNGSGGVGYSSSKNIFFNQQITLLGPGEYSSNEIPFRYTIPATVLPKRFGSFGKIGSLPDWVSSILNLIITLMGMNGPQFSIEFSLNAKADIPWGIDITESIFLSIEQENSDTINIPSPSQTTMKESPQ